MNRSKTWLISFFAVFALGVVYYASRGKDVESQRIVEDTRQERTEAPQAQPQAVAPPAFEDRQPGGVPEARQDGSDFKAPEPVAPPPPAAFDNLPPPPSQIYPEMPSSDLGEMPDPYDGIDPQYVPTEPLDGDLRPPGEEE